MEAVSRMASPKQVEFLEDLSERTGTKIKKPLESLTSQEASELIDELLEKEGRPVGVEAEVVRKRRFGDERTLQARLGMAFKLVYQACVVRSEGCVKRPSFEKRENFINEVIEVFEVMNEVASRAGLDGNASG